MDIFEFYYCKDCELLLFKWNKRVSHHGLSYRELDKEGFEVETDFDCRDTDVWEIECFECGTELDGGDNIELPLKLALQIKALIGDNSGVPLKLEDHKKFKDDDFDPSQAKGLLMESLL